MCKLIRVSLGIKILQRGQFYIKVAIENFTQKYNIKEIIIITKKREITTSKRYQTFPKKRLDNRSNFSECQCRDSGYSWTFWKFWGQLQVAKSMRKAGQIIPRYACIGYTKMFSLLYAKRSLKKKTNNSKIATFTTTSSGLKAGFFAEGCDPTRKGTKRRAEA